MGAVGLAIGEEELASISTEYLNLLSPCIARQAFRLWSASQGLLTLLFCRADRFVLPNECAFHRAGAIVK